MVHRALTLVIGLLPCSPDHFSLGGNCGLGTRLVLGMFCELCWKLNVASHIIHFAEVSYLFCVHCCVSIRLCVTMTNFLGLFPNSSKEKYGWLVRLPGKWSGEPSQPSWDSTHFATSVT